MYFKLFIPLLFVLFTSCKKEDPVAPPTTTGNGAPSINLTSPANNSQYNQNDNVPIIAGISDDKEIYTLLVQVKNLGDNSVVTHSNNHIHQANYSLSTSHSIAAAGNYQLIITATDLDGNSSQSTVDITIN